MRKSTPITLSQGERDHLQCFVRRGKANARTLARARVLLKSDAGWTDAQIADVLDLCVQTVSSVQQRFLTGGVQTVLTDKRQERRRQALTDQQAAHVIAIACSEVPDGHDHWTLRMLAGKAVELEYVTYVSPETVRQLLKKMP